MAHLALLLFGTFRVTLDGDPVTTFEYDKVRALLAYLAMEANQPHRRERLAGLLWPEQPERTARHSLSQALLKLRHAVGDHESARTEDAGSPFLLVDHWTIQFDQASDHFLDVTAFRGLLEACDRHQHRQFEDCDPCRERLEQAVALYQGGFLEGFSLPDSAAFEEWVLLNRERLHRLVMDALDRLARCYERRGEYEAGLRHAWRQVELDPWWESAHRQVMRLLALSGQRGAALAQYEECLRLLAEELDVEPAEETTRLYEQIRAGELEGPVVPLARLRDLPARPPPFLDEEAAVEVERPVFVARERELAWLEGYLDQALAGQGRVIFVTGGAGRGKTALIQEFARRAQAVHPELVVASGNGNAFTGVGDAYHPFREVLDLLTGDVEARWAAGALTTDHARRLWHTLPQMAGALVEAGPDLIDTFVSGTALAGRATACAAGAAEDGAWLARLEELVALKAAVPSEGGPGQTALFEQYTRVLGTLARQAPLLLILDDLQWADLGSISLLFHLGKGLKRERILLVGAYRPEEVASGRPSTSFAQPPALPLALPPQHGAREQRERHPLEPVVHEFRRGFGEIIVDLRKVEGRGFVEAFVDHEPNRLGAAFRDALYRQTGGHALFTVELLRGLQERGDLVQDAAGHWVEGPTLNWEMLPARAEAVIAERIGRLAAPSREALRVASVEGEVFTAEVTAQVRATDEREMVERLSGELDKRQRLVRAEAIQRLGTRRLSRYRFRHSLFQQYLYNSLDDVERAHLHEAVGTTLEALYGEAAGEVAVDLARHFQEAGLTDKAIDYLRKAGDRAVRILANEEAIAHFRQALALLATLPDSGGEEHRLERDQVELALQLALGAPLVACSGFTAPEFGQTMARARELCQRAHGGESPELISALFFLNIFHGLRAEYQTAIELGEQALRLAESAEDHLLMAWAHFSLGWVLDCVGDFPQARAHLEHVIAFYDPEQHRSLSLSRYGADAGVFALSWVASSLWYLGYPDQALHRSQEALALAQELDHPFTLVQALGSGAAMTHMRRREVQAAQEYIEAEIRFSTEWRFVHYRAAADCRQGWAQVDAGQVEEGIARLRQALAARQAMGANTHRTLYSIQLAEGYKKAGRVEEGLDVLAEASLIMQDTGERCYEAELYRVNGELLLTRSVGDEAEAEASLHQAETCFQHAIEVARQQSAKSWELRATMSLCHLWCKQGKREAARQMLEEIYGWFTEGFDTGDLQEAKALLEELDKDPQN